jgi:hypothetical protein
MRYAGGSPVWRLAALWAALLGGVAAGLPPVADLPFCAALYTREAPQLDGVPGEACWQRAERTTPFVAVGGQPVEAAAQAMACWDDTRLYVAFVCPEPRLADSGERLAQGAAPFAESIELFLDPTYDRYSYLQFRVDILGRRDTHRRGDPAPELTGQWTGAAHRDTGQWTVEIAVPFALLGTALPQAGTLWSANANRTRALAPAGQVWSCWSDTQGGFHSPARFGHLVFCDFRAFLRFHFRAQIDAEEQRLGDLVVRYPQVADSLVSCLARLDQQQAEFLRQVAAGRFTDAAERRAGIAQGLALLDAYQAALAETRLLVLRDILR